MKPPFRHLILGAAIAFFFSLTLASLAQEPQPPAPPAPPSAPTTAAPASPDGPASPVAAEPVPAEQVQKPTAAEPPLRRLDVPADGGEDTKAKSPAGRRRGEPRSSQRGGDAPFGDHTVAAGSRTREAVSIMGATLVYGTVDTDAVSVLGRTVVGSEGRVGGDAVAVLGRLESKGTVGKGAVSVLGGVDIDGPVGGEVVSVLGDMHLGPNAVVQGDIVLVGGKLTKDPQAVVRGNQVNVPFLGSVGDVSWFTTWVKRCVFWARPLAFGEHLGWAWLVALSFLGFYVLLALLFRDGIDKCVTTLEARPGLSLLSALLTVLLSPVVMILLIATVVGLVLVPFLGIALVLATLFGKAVMLAWVGRRFTRFFGDGPLAHPAVAVIVGGALVLLLYTIPIFGFLLFKLLGWIGLGVVVCTLALAMKREKAAPPAGSAPTTPSAGEPVAAAPALAPAVATPVVAPMVSPGFGAAEGVAPPAPATPVGSMGFAAAIPPTIAEPAPAAVPVAPPVTAVPPPPVAPAAAAPRLLPPLTAGTLPRAGFMIRLGALALDAILVGMIVGFVSGLMPRFLHLNSGPGGVLLALAVYGAVMWKHKGTTIGGIVCGLKVVRLDNREIDWATAVVRALSCFLSLVVAGLGFIWVAFDDEKQSWHDKIAGTTVVLVPKGVSLL